LSANCAYELLSTVTRFHRLCYTGVSFSHWGQVHQNWIWIELVKLFTAESLLAHSNCTKIVLELGLDRPIDSDVSPWPWFFRPKSKSLIGLVLGLDSWGWWMPERFPAPSRMFVWAYSCRSCQLERWMTVAVAVKPATGGLGERRKLPQRGSGRGRAENEFGAL